MTKQEYEKKYDECNNWLGNITVCKEYIASLEAENAALTLLHTQATDEMLKMQNRVHELEAENAKLEKLNSAALELLSRYACLSDHNNNDGHQCNDSNDCVACWREYLGGENGKLKGEANEG